MDARAILAAAILATMAATVAAAACGSTTPPQPDGERHLAHPSTHVPATAPLPNVATRPAPVPESPPAPGPRDDVAAAAAAALSCADPIAALMGLPDGGVVFNNAMTSADAGLIDRAQGILDALGARDRELRCCFDAWLRTKPDREATALLVVALSANGNVIDANIDDGRTTVDDPVVRACLVMAARAARYPKSPTNSESVVEYPIRAARRR